MKLEPIKKTRVYEQVIERIKESIEQGFIRPGEKLPSERELAAQLSISRSVIREAMSVLNTSGILDVRQGIGIFLTQDDTDRLLKRINRVLMNDDIQLIELLEVRQGLESQAAYLAAQRASEKDIQEIYSALNRLEQAVKNNLLAAAEDYAFHAAVVRASQNETMVEMLYLLSDRILACINESGSKSIGHPQIVETVLKEHFDIYSAIANGDAERSRDMMNHHIEHAKIHFTQTIQEE